jgi:hypothetical protein
MPEKDSREQPMLDDKNAQKSATHGVPTTEQEGQAKTSPRAARRQAAKAASRELLESKRRAAQETEIALREQRKARAQSTREKIAELRALLRSKGIPLPIRFEFAKPTKDATKEDDSVQDCGRGIYVVRSADTGTRYKVQLKSERWTCSCPSWTKNRGLDCKHIERVQEVLGKGRPYAGVRRRPATVIIYDEKELAEATRRERAYRDWPIRCPELFEELCAAIPEPEITKLRGGAPSIPLRVKAYALLMKAHLGMTYAELSHHLASDRAIQRLGWLRDTPLSITTLSHLCADARLLYEYKKMIFATADTGREVETTAALDASCLVNSLAANHNEEKLVVAASGKARTI